MASKMYILMKRELITVNKDLTEKCGEEVHNIQIVDDGHVALGACHGTLMCYLRFQETEAMKDWLKNSFRKVLCVVNENEWWQARSFCFDKVIVTESAFGGEEIGMVFAPREEFPKCFKSYRLFKGKGDINPDNKEMLMAKPDPQDASNEKFDV
jgi:hypothetical protein